MFNIVPSGKGFHELFEKSAAAMECAAVAYTGLCADGAHAEEHLARIRGLEHEGDEITHRTLAKLDTTFLTPFDREDIQTLAMQVDDVIDAIDAAAKRIVLFKVPLPDPWLIKQTDVLLRATRRVVQAIALLRRLKKPDHIREHLLEIHVLENLGDDNHNAALTDLYEHHSDPIAVMKLKEIYDRTEKAIDLCEDIANTVERIILKNT